MKTDNLRALIRKRSSSKGTAKRKWGEVESATLEEGSGQVEFFFINNKGYIRAKLKQIYCQDEERQEEGSPKTSQLTLSSSRFLLRDFLLEELGERLRVIDNKII